MSKKICIVANTSWYAWNFRLNLAKSLKNAGYDVVFIVPQDDEYTNYLKKEFEVYQIYMDLKGINPFNDIKTIYHFYNLYKEISPNIVLNYTIKPNIYSSLVASTLKIDVINNITGLGSLFIKKSFITTIAKCLYKFSQKKAKKIFFQNSDDFEMFVKENLVQKEKCDVLPGSGVDIDKFQPILRENNEVFKVLLISRMLWAKGVGEFVEAAKIIKNKHINVEFQLLGHLNAQSPTAIPKNQIDIWIDKGYINYLGKSDDVKTEISQVDCVVLPSYYREGTPRVLLEACAMEKPIITTNAIGCKDVVDDGINGYMCKIKDAKDLALKMERMLKLSIKERDDMGKAGRKKIEESFDEKIVINKYLEEIEKL